MAANDETIGNTDAYSPPPAIDAETLARHGQHPTGAAHAAGSEQLHAEGQQLEGAGARPTIDGVSARLDRLEAQIADRQRRWYRDAASVVAVLALLFSFGTTVVSLQRTAQQDTHDKKLELLSLIDRLSTVTRDFADAQTAYADDPSTLSTISSVLTQQELLAAEQAASVMKEIPGEVSSAEFTFVGNILVANGLDNPGLYLLQDAIDTATNVNDLVSSLRSRAYRLFQIGQADEGRALYRRALDVFTRFDDPGPLYVAYTHLQTQLGWAQAELSIGSCVEAKVHLDAARQYVPQFPANDSRVQQVGALGPLVAACLPGTSQPSPAPGSS